VGEHGEGSPLLPRRTAGLQPEKKAGRMRDSRMSQSIGWHRQLVMRVESSHGWGPAPYAGGTDVRLCRIFFNGYRPADSAPGIHKHNPNRFKLFTSHV
jgi:hypothetical protein